MIKGTLDGVLGNSFVERRDPKPSMWDHTSIPGMKGEIPMWLNPRTGKMEPVDGYPGPVHGGWGRHPEFPKPAPGWGHHPMPPKPAPGWGHHPRVKTMEWNYERDGYPRPIFGPIGTYDPRFPPQVEPLGKGW